MLLQSGRLHLPKTPEAEALGRELLDYEIKVDENANDRYGAFRVGTHDDLLTAIGLATQRDDVGPVLIQPISFLKLGGSTWRPTSPDYSYAWLNQPIACSVGCCDAVRSSVAEPTDRAIACTEKQARE